MARLPLKSFQLINFGKIAKGIKIKISNSLVVDSIFYLDNEPLLHFINGLFSWNGSHLLIFPYKEVDDPFLDWFTTAC